MTRQGYLPKDQRKTILLLSDDLRLPSGVGNMSREIVLRTAHRYNWVQLGAAINHPEFGKIMDASDSLKNDTGIEDPYLRIYPYNGYGDAPVIRTLIEREKIDGILHFTDPRFWIWLYQIEHELRQKLPIMFYHVWDNLPFPKYNQAYYRSCDHISCISRQTYNIVKNVWKKGTPEKWQVDYVPHGVDEKIFFHIAPDSPEYAKVTTRKKELFGDAEVDFVVLYNNRNVRRKSTSDIIVAYDKFTSELTEEQRKRCRLVLHTQAVDENGTDLPAVCQNVTPNANVVIDESRLSPDQLNVLYNISDVVINMASAEGFGLGTLEAMVAERLIIANVTGGLQDQMGFRDDHGNLVNEDEHFNAEWGSNADGKYKTHGEWVFPIWPNNRSLIGSPPTPYIFDDRCSYDDAAAQLRAIYELSPEERHRRGTAGRQYAIDNKMTADQMGEKFIECIDKTFANWKPRSRFDLLKV